ncbi:MAG: CHC2 zinc finger domain-containing protein [Desulfotomaculales bacterium]
MTFDEIIARLDKISFFSKRGVVIKKNSGRNCEGSCPFCRDEEHFSFSKESGLWQCYKCRQSGNVVSFLKKLGHDYKEARKIIAEEAGVIEENVVPLSRQKKTQNKAPNKNAAGNARTGAAKAPPDKPVVSRIYARVCELLPLTDIHRQQLKAKRGFTDGTIDRLQFRSLGQHAAKLKDKLREEFAEEDLVESGVLVKVNNQLIVNSQLLEDRVLIPYLGLTGTFATDGTGATNNKTAPGQPTGPGGKNDNGAATFTTDGTGADNAAPGRPGGPAGKNPGREAEVYYIRPHKLGFEKIAPQIYCRYLLQSFSNVEHVVLTEGEFKAAALWQWRIPAVAVPGVSSFGVRHLERLVAFLREFGVKKVTVIFDNEIKDNPEYPNYKPKASDRYDTQLWAYLMAHKLGREGFDARVGWLPDEWREKGKIDFDGALAQGRTREEILNVIARAKPPREFLEDLDEEARRIVQRKISQHFTRLNIRREFNRYVVTRYRGGEAYEETISNFVINIKSSFFTPEGVVRNVQFINEHGEASAVFPLEPSEMAGPNEFKKFCFSKGNYIYKGKGDDLTNIWELELGRDTGEIVYMPDKIFQLENDLWLTGNMAIKKGKVYLPDNDGIVWIDGKGYKPQSLQINTRGEATEDAIISLSTRPVDILDVAEKIRDCVGGYEAYVALGWVIACIFSRRIFEEYHCSPILFVHGRKESGKTTLLRWLMWFFGLDTEGFNLAETSQNFITRALAYYSGMGVWFDEYRNETRITQKDGFFRSAYNRQLSGKGTPTAFQTKGFAVNACVAISGEELPKDSGLFTRCVPVQVSEYKRGRRWFEWLNKNCSDFSGFTYQLLLNYDNWAEKVLKNIADLKKALLNCGISDRTATNWAICAGAFDAVVKQDDGFIRWVEQACQEIRQAAESGHMLSLSGTT